MAKLVPKCLICGKRYASRDSLLRHGRTKHGTPRERWDLKYAPKRPRTRIAVDESVAIVPERQRSWFQRIIETIFGTV